MFRRFLLLVIFAVLAYGFWISPSFKEIAAGVAIFLFGMLSLEEGFKAFTGGLLERFLRYSTDKFWKSLSFGMVSTTLMQSSSLVSVITISFLSAGLIGLAQGIGIIFGANIGTTTGAWLVAGFGLKVKISAYAMPMLVFGVLFAFQKSKHLKGLGYILAGLGFLFLGIHYMKEGFEAFKAHIDLSAYAVEGFEGLLIFTGIGIGATVVMQSSHATLVLTITALATGQITYDNGLALAIGSNIGTTITAILGSLTANIAGKRLAGAHLIFNLTTGLIAIGFIEHFRWAVDYISVHTGIAADDYTLKLAVFHTLFNLVGVAVMSPLIGWLVVLLEKVLRADLVEKYVSYPRYLNEAVGNHPDTALKALSDETRHLFDNAFEIISHGLNMHREDILSDKDLYEVAEDSRRSMQIDIDDLYERRIKELYSGIIKFSAQAETQMEPAQIDRLYRIKMANRDMVDAIKDMKDLQKNMAFYIKSDNTHIRREYNQMRTKLAAILRTVYRIAEPDEEDNTTVLALDKHKIQIEQNDIVANGTLDKLIRKGLINSRMATSLMNDNAYVYNISRHLIDTAQVLYSAEQPHVQSAEQEIALDENDVEDLMTEPSVEAEKMSRAGH